MLIESLFPYVLPDVPGAPDITARQAILLTAIDFCNKTEIWDEIQAPYTLVDNTRDYSLTAPTDARVMAVKSAWAYNRELRPVTMIELQQLMPNWPVLTGSQVSYYNAPTDVGTIRVYPIPLDAQGAQMTLRVMYSPILTATTLPDFLVNQHLEALAAGAKHRLMLTPNKSWSNQKLALDQLTIYNNLVNEARIKILHDRVQGTIKVKSVRFGP